MEYLIGSLAGLAAGLLANWVFLRYLRLRPPKVEISPLVMFSPEEQALRVKIVNRSRRQVTNIDARMALIKRESIRLDVLRRFDLVQDRLVGMNGAQSKQVPWAPPYAITFKTRPVPDIEALLNRLDDDKIRIAFTLSVTDAVSGTTKLVRQTYGAQYRIKYSTSAAEIISPIRGLGQHVQG